MAGSFFRAWTRKEAFVKALDVRLALDLGQFSVSLDGEEARLLSWAGHDDEVEHRSIRDLKPTPHLCGALAMIGDGEAVYLFRRNAKPTT